MCIRIPDDQVVFRSIHHPYAFASKGKKFDSSRSWNLKRYDNALVASVIWQRFAPNALMVHRYGCRNSQKRNSAGNKRDVYCGFYALDVSAVRQIKASEGIVAANVEHKIELGEIAHANLFATIDAHVDPDDLEAAKTYFLDRLWRLMAGPCLYTCPADSDLADHPRLQLPGGYLGSYMDSRRLLRRISDWLWYLIGTLRWSKTARQLQE